MKSLFRLIVGLGFTTCLGLTAAELPTTPFALGPTGFRNGDAIVIEQVSASSPNLAVGDTVVVRGHYQLGSRDKATLMLILTQTSGDGRENISPAQTVAVAKGSGPFELRYTVTHPGALHVSFYGAPREESFGGVYFGTAAQMEKIKNWAVSH